MNGGSMRKRRSPIQKMGLQDQVHQMTKRFNMSDYNQIQKSLKRLSIITLAGFILLSLCVTMSLSWVIRDNVKNFKDLLSETLVIRDCPIAGVNKKTW